MFGVRGPSQSAFDKKMAFPVRTRTPNTAFLEGIGFLTTGPAENRNDAQPGARPVPWWHLHRRLYNWVLHWADTPYGTPALCVLAFTESSFFPIPPDVLLIALGISKPRRAFYYATVCSALSVLGGMFGYLIGYALWNPVGAPILRSLGLLNASHQAVRVVRVEDKHNLIVVRAEDGTALKPGRWSQWLGIARPPEPGTNGNSVAMYRALLHGKDPRAADARVGERGYEEEQTSQETANLTQGQTAYFMTDTYHQARALYGKYDFWIVFAAAFTPIPYKVFTILSGLMTMSFVPFLLASVIGRSMRFFLVSTLIYACGQRIRTFIERYFNLISLAFFVLLFFFFAILSL